MTPELEATLIKRYPDVFRDAGGDPGATCMAFGIAVGDGWFDLLDTLCSGLTWPLRQAQQRLMFLRENEGKAQYGGQVIDAAVIAAQEAKVEEVRASIPVAAQVKEKFGGLRFYVNAATPEQGAMIDFAERMSVHVCEVCGNRGMIYPAGWVRTLCPTHGDEAHGDKAAQMREAGR